MKEAMNIVWLKRDLRLQDHLPFLEAENNSKKILKAAIKVGGTTLKDFYSADGSPGYFNFALKVYGREGLQCKVCDDKIKKINLNTRATYYCNNCQI